MSFSQGHAGYDRFKRRCLAYPADRMLAKFVDDTLSIRINILMIVAQQLSNYKWNVKIVKSKLISESLAF